MTWRPRAAKILLVVGLVGYPALLAFGVAVRPLMALLGGVALALVTPIVFVVFMDMVDQLRGPGRPPKAR